VLAQKESEGPAAGSAHVPLFLRSVLALIGFTAVIAQIVLMRELVVVFYGNEVSLGLMLANWLLWTALGSSALGRRAGRGCDPRKLMAALQVLVALAFPLTILAVRASKTLLQPIPGELLGPGPMLLTSLLTLSFFCLISGLLFAAGSRLYADTVGAPTAAASSSVYLLEAVGAGLGGILASLVLIRYLDASQIALLLSLLNLMAATALAVRTPARRRFALGALLVVFMLAVIPFGSRRLESVSLARLWRGFHVVATKNSLYGNLAVIQTESSRSLYENGLVVFTVPDPAAAEEAVHYALLQHPSPRSVLLIGGGVSGSVAQILQHPSVAQVDYAELDPAILNLAQQYFPEAWSPIASDPRVRLHRTDGRLFLKTCTSKFDVIIVNLPDPQTAHLNRFYTEEFFREAARKLEPDGLFSFQVTGAEDYISPGLADFLRCLNKTLRTVFPEVTAIPGSEVHFFAANRPGTLTTNPAVFVERLRARQLRTLYVREYYIPFRLTPDRLLDLELQISPQADTPINRDFAPIAYYFDMALWSTRFHPASTPWFATLAAIKFGKLLAAIAAVLFLLAGLIRWWPQIVAGVSDGKASALIERRYRGMAGFSVAAMGFTLLGLELLLLLGFQAIYGYVYQQLALLIAAFMLGIALGSWGALRRLGAERAASGAVKPGQLRLLGALQLVAAISPLLLYGLFRTFARVGSGWELFVISQGLFPILSMLVGFLGGFQFPLASRIYFSSSVGKVGNPGALYGLDLVGSCLGAVALSAYLVPVFGFLRTAVLVALVNLAPAVLAFFSAPGTEAPQG
jgi:spermidine synthase